MPIQTNTITSCLVRFFLNKAEFCERQYECGEIPVIPKKGEIVRLTADWEPYKVANVDYAYPFADNDTRLMIDIFAEECKDYDFEEDENW